MAALFVTFAAAVAGQVAASPSPPLTADLDALVPRAEFTKCMGKVLDRMDPAENEDLQAYVEAQGKAVATRRAACGLEKVLEPPKCRPASARWVLHPDGRLDRNPDGEAGYLALSASGWPAAVQVRLRPLGATAPYLACTAKRNPADLVIALEGRAAKTGALDLEIWGQFPLTQKAGEAGVAAELEALLKKAAKSCASRALQSSRKVQAAAAAARDAYQTRQVALTNGQPLTLGDVAQATEALRATLRTVTATIVGALAKSTSTIRDGAREAGRARLDAVPTPGLDPTKDIEAMEKIAKTFLDPVDVEEGPTLSEIGAWMDRKLAVDAGPANSPMFQPILEVAVPTDDSGHYVVDMVPGTGPRHDDAKVSAHASLVVLGRNIPQKQANLHALESEVGGDAPAGASASLGGLLAGVASLRSYLDVALAEADHRAESLKGFNAAVQRTPDWALPANPAQSEIAAHSYALAAFVASKSGDKDAERAALDALAARGPKNLENDFVTQVRLSPKVTPGKYFVAKLKAKPKADAAAEVVAERHVDVRPTHRWFGLAAEVAWSFTNPAADPGYVSVGAGGGDQLFVLRDRADSGDRLTVAALLVVYPFAMLKCPNRWLEGVGVGLGPTVFRGGDAEVGRQFNVRAVYEFPESGVLLTVGGGVGAEREAVVGELGEVVGVPRPAAMDATAPTLETESRWTHWTATAGLAFDTAVFADALTKLTGGSDK